MSFAQVVADAKLKAVSEAIQRYFPSLQGAIFTGIYFDISPNWYRFVGGKLALTLLIQVIVIICKSGFIYVYDWWERRGAKRARCQPDMNRYGRVYECISSFS
jgi:hypothetical protein